MNRFSYIIIGLTILITIIFLSKSLDNPNLWLDESGQFWMSKGLNHFSAPFQPEGDLKNVVRQNRIFNMDPGGFTVLLHFWTKISNNYIWLRLLPFLFMLFTMAVFSLITFAWTKNYIIALLMGLLPVFSSVIVQFAFEIRAYSMEYLGTALAVLFIERSKEKLNYRSLLIFSILLAILITSRYSVIIPITIAVLLVLKLILKNKDIKHKFLSIIILGFPFLVSAIMIYLFTFQYQNPEVSLPAYVKTLMLKYNITFIKSNDFIIYNIPFVIFIELYLLCKKYFKLIANKFDSLFIMVVANNLIFIILSLLGKHPIDISSRWCISLHILSYLSLAAIFAMIYMVIASKINKPLSIKKLNWVTLITCINIVFMILSFNIGYRQMDLTYNYLAKLDLNNCKKILVHKYAEPNIRYFFEYGLMKGAYNKKIYPDKFEFSDTAKIKSLSENDLQQYDLIIMPCYNPISYVCYDDWVKLDDKGVLWIKKTMIKKLSRSNE